MLPKYMSQSIVIKKRANLVSEQHSSDDEEDDDLDDEILINDIA